MLDGEVFFEKIKGNPLTNEFLKKHGGRFQIDPSDTLFYEDKKGDFYFPPDTLGQLWDVISKSINENRNLLINPDNKWKSNPDNQVDIWGTLK